MDRVTCCRDTPKAGQRGEDSDALQPSHLPPLSLSKALTVHQKSHSNTPETFISDNGFGFLGPARCVHVDGDIAGAQMQGLLTPEQFADCSNRPYAVVKVCRTLKTVLKDPLVVIDTRTPPREDMMTDAFMIFGRKKKEIVESVGIKRRADPTRHRWHFVKDLRPQEALEFNIIDKRASHKDFLGVARSSFIDPEMEGFVDDRKSVEIRSLCFF